MSLKRFIYLFCALIINVSSLFSEEQDSLFLLKALKQATSNQQKVKANIALSKYFLQKNFTKSLEYAKAANSLSVKTDYKEGLASAFGIEGEVNFMLANYEEAQSNYTEALSIYKQINYSVGVAESYAGLGKVAYKLGESDAALTHFSEALKIFEKEKHINALPGIYINIGLLYDEANNFKQAIEFYNKALVLAKEINDEVSEASCYTNLGSIYTAQGNYKLAIEYFEKSLKIKKELGNKKGIGVTLNNLGAVYYEMANLDMALEYFQNAYNIYLELGDTKSSFPACNNIGTIYFEKRNYVKALEYFNKNFELAKASTSISRKITSLENLTMVHKALGNTAMALDFCMECSSLKDTLYNKDQAEITAEMQTKFASEKKQQENEILNLQVKSESFIKTIFIIVAALLLVFAFFIYRSSQQKQKINIALEEKNKIIEEQKQTVEHQKHIVEEQNKDIKDSIRYAERIQNAILPPEQMWNSILPHSFVFYKPKDILSGDFYWIEQKGDLIFIAAADCTGHGVPGALISIVNYNLLNKATLEKDLNDPADILNYVNSQLIVALHQTYQESSVKDGMDISLCVLNKKTLQLHFAGANNPIYIFKNKELTQINADKFPVGAFIEEKIQYFNSQKLQLQKNDVIYLFSDGYADQFGGPKGKKFKYKQLKEILENIHELPMPEQNNILSNKFNSWQGNLEQVDDVLVMGIKV